MLIARFKKDGIIGLQPRKLGRKKDKINAHFKQFVLQLWAKFPEEPIRYGLISRKEDLVYLKKRFNKSTKHTN
jgi:hypothetical protein